VPPSGVAIGLLIAISLSSDRTHVIADYKQRSDRDQKLIEASPSCIQVKTYESLLRYFGTVQVGPKCPAIRTTMRYYAAKTFRLCITAIGKSKTLFQHMYYFVGYTMLQR